MKREMSRRHLRRAEGVTEARFVAVTIAGVGGGVL